MRRRSATSIDTEILPNFETSPMPLEKQRSIGLRKAPKRADTAIVLLESPISKLSATSIGIQSSRRLLEPIIGLERSSIGTKRDLLQIKIRHVRANNLRNALRRETTALAVAQSSLSGRTLMPRVQTLGQHGKKASIGNTRRASRSMESKSVTLLSLVIQPLVNPSTASVK